MNASRTRFFSGRWLSGCRRPATDGRVGRSGRIERGRIERGRIEPGRIEPGRLEGGRIERISRSSDISSVFRSGRFRRTRGLKLGYASNDLGHHRVAFAPTRSLRRAVDRNRQKRISREAYRQLFGDIAGSYDLVFVIYGDASTTTRDRRTDMVTVLDAAGLLERPKR